MPVPAIIAGAAAIGGAAIASSGAKSAAQKQAEAQQNALNAQQAAAAKAEADRARAVQLKQDAAKNIKFPTFLETPEAQKYKGILEDRIAGRGLIDVNAQTAPVAQQVRAGLEQTKAAISSSASARGLGRSSLVTGQTGAASASAERDIASRVAQLELARQEQIGQAVSQFGALSETESVSQQNKARFKQGAEFNIADTIANNANQTKNDQFAISNAIAQNGANEASWQLLNSQILAAGLIGAGQSYQSGATQAADSLLEKMRSEQTSRGATVNIGNSRLVGNPTNTAGLGANLGGF